MWGKHLSIDASDCNELRLSPEDLAKWVRELVKRIDMVAYGDPQIIHFGKDDPKLAGWTVSQLIETSNIMAHFCDNTGEAYIDVFSCKDFDPAIVEKHFQETFEPSAMIATVKIRKAP